MKQRIRQIVLSVLAATVVIGTSQVGVSQQQGDNDFPQRLPLLPGLPPGAMAPSQVTDTDPLVLIQRYTAGTGALVNCKETPCVFRTPDVVNMMIANGLKDATETTKRRFDALVNDAKNSLVNITTDLWKPDGLIGQSMASQGAREFIRSEELFRAYAKFQSDVMVARMRIGMLSTFFQAKLEGIPLDDQNLISKNYPTAAPATVNQFLATFEGGIRAINRAVCAQNYLVIFPTGESQTNDGVNTGVYDTTQGGMKITQSDGGNGVHPLRCGKDASGIDDSVVRIVLAPKAINILRAKIDDMRNRMEDLRSPREEVVLAVDSLHKLMREDVLSFAKVFGADQGTWNRLLGLCPKMICGGLSAVNDARTKSEEDAYNDIIRDFWIRSLFRKIKGVGVGGFTIQYDQAYESMDIFKSTTLMISNVGVDPLYTKVVRNGHAVNSVNFEKTVREQLFVYEKALNKAGSKAAILLKSDSVAQGLNKEKGTGSLIVNGNSPAGLFDYANSSWEAVKGTADKWKATYLVLKLMAADLYEEKLVRSPGGLAQMQNYYRNRYVAIPKADREIFQRYISEGFQQNVLGQRGNVGRNSDVQTQDENSIKGVTSHLRNVMDTYISRVSEARMLELQVRAAQNQDTADEFKAEDLRADDI